MPAAISRIEINDSDRLPAERRHIAKVSFYRIFALPSDPHSCLFVSHQVPPNHGHQFLTPSSGIV